MSRADDEALLDWVNGNGTMLSASGHGASL